MQTQAVALATQDVGPAAGAGDAGLHEQRIDHVAARLMAKGGLWGDSHGD
jgi:hypothetical protein